MPESVGLVGPDFADIEKRTEADIEFISFYPPSQFAASASGCALAHTTPESLELGTRGAPPLFGKNISKAFFFKMVRHQIFILSVGSNTNIRT